MIITVICCVSLFTTIATSIFYSVFKFHKQTNERIAMVAQHRRKTRRKPCELGNSDNGQTAATILLSHLSSCAVVSALYDEEQNLNMLIMVITPAVGSRNRGSFTLL
uniref:Putative secreted peptide n=1 Tax=Anopheles braziliensis TaxID=58242 RepID=A0A2M3ZQ36_9DIPT